MTAKEALANIKKLLSTKFNDDEQKFEAGKLSDGTVIEATKLEAGGDLVIIAADGAKNPAPAGEYELEDGRILVVTEPGKIAEVKDAAAKEEEGKTEEEMKKQQEQKMAEGEESVVDWAPEIASLKRDLAYYAKTIATLQNAMATFRAETKSVFDQVALFMEEVSKEDTDSAKKNPKQTVFTEQKNKKEEAKKKFAEAFQKFGKTLNEKK